MYIKPTPFTFLLGIPVIIITIISMIPKGTTNKRYAKTMNDVSAFLRLFTSRLIIFPLFLAVFVYYIILLITLPNIALTRYLVLANIIIFEATTLLTSFKKILSKRKLDLIKFLTPFIDFYIVLMAFFYSSTIRSTDPLKAFSIAGLEAYPGVLVMALGMFLISKHFYIEIYKKKKLKRYLDVITWLIYIIIVYFVLDINI